MKAKAMSSEYAEIRKFTITFSMKGFSLLERVTQGHVCKVM